MSGTISGQGSGPVTGTDEVVCEAAALAAVLCKEAWVARYDGASGDGADRAKGLAVSPDGSRVYVTGESRGDGGDPTNSSDYVTVAYHAATGNRIWVSRYDGPRSGLDRATALELSPDGSRIYVTGWSAGVGTGYDVATVTYDAATGEELRVTRYNWSRNGSDGANALRVSPDGSRVYVSGGSQDGYFGYVTVAYDAVTGARLWVTSYFARSGHGQAYAVDVSPDGSRVFVTGQSGGVDATVAYDAVTGDQLWDRRGEMGSDGGAWDVSVSPDGASVYLTGYRSGAGTGSDYATVAYGAVDGSELWAARYDGPGNRRDIATALEVSPDGSRVFVTGQSIGADNSYDVATIAYDAASGGEHWVSRYDGPAVGYVSYTTAQELVVSPDGSWVVVTGFGTLVGNNATGGTDNDYVTMAYDAAVGLETWSARYNGPGSGNDVTHGVAVSPDGARLFVTGYGPGVTTGSDYATVAYDLARPLL